MRDSSTTHCAGYVAIVGRPNVGKSTLLNVLVGQKVSITSKKAQTTRHRITGIRTDLDVQFVFVDTPGFQTAKVNALNRALNRAVTHGLQEVDAVLFVIEALRFDERDRQVLRLVPRDRPVLLVINKVDEVADKGELLPFMEEVSKEFPFAEVVPVSAKTAANLGELVKALRAQVPEGAALFSPEQVTDCSERFLASELIREKAFRLLGEEVPYSVSVVIDRFVEENGLRHVHATLYVEKPGHKAIVIGRKGEKLKAIATQARKEMERLFGGKVFLEVWVKVKRGWTDDEDLLKSLGYDA
ncbi:MAG: GTPase Era [Betaproteobacteria bacterium]|nr:GTPase Era [Betaproteobacteria bacterium]